MTPYEHASAFYSRSPYKSGHLTQLLSRFLQGGCVVCTPQVFVLAEVHQWHDYPSGPRDNYWFIEYLSGDMATALTLMPFWLPYVAFARRGRMKVYATATLVNRILTDERLQNRDGDPLLRRWRRGQGETTGTTGTDGCSGEFGEGESFRPPTQSPWLRCQPDR
jgi:hypothetical protein